MQRATFRLITILNIHTGIQQKLFPRMAFMFSPPPNTFHSNTTAPTVRYLRDDGGIIVNSIPHFPAIPHSFGKIGEVENDFIQSK